MMNDMFKKLADEAKQNIRDRMQEDENQVKFSMPIVITQEEINEEFAKLLLQDTFTILRDCYRFSEDAEEWDNALTFFERHLKEHFGVDYDRN